MSERILKIYFQKPQGNYLEYPQSFQCFVLGQDDNLFSIQPFKNLPC